MTSERCQWGRLVDQAGSISDEVVELSALSGTELPSLLSYLTQRPSLNFEYVSVHGPAKEWHSTDSELARVLMEKLPTYVDSLVMHPESISMLNEFRALGSKLVLENMDRLKSSARTVGELEMYFEALPDAGFCFDIAHARMNDPTMRLASDLLDAFGDRLREVHLSSILDDGTHVSLREEDVNLYWPILDRCRDVPWVLEAALPGV